MTAWDSDLGSRVSISETTSESLQEVCPCESLFLSAGQRSGGTPPSHSKKEMLMQIQVFWYLKVVGLGLIHLPSVLLFFFALLFKKELFP